MQRDHGLLPRPFWLVTGSLGILLLLIVQVNAALALSIGSHADYSLSGTLQTSATCNVDQTLYWVQACGYGASPGTIPVSIPTGKSVTVLWVDDGTCSPGSSACSFDPGYLAISTGSLVLWVHQGTLAHTVTANSTANVGLPNFYSGVVQPGSTYGNYFSVPGNYSYYCSIHPWMKGKLNVVGSPSPVPSPAPVPQSIVANLYGSLGWNVKGLGSTVADLQVDHNVSLSITPLPLVSYAPLREQGSFPQSINLTTRIESPGTAAGLAVGLLGSLAKFYGGSLRSYGLGGTLGPYANRPDYTMWWVNGPLSLGSPVQILNGYGSVTGNESLDLGGTIGTRNAWIVTSDLSQSLNTNAFSLTNAKIAVALNLLWSFDKEGDLLLRSNTNVSFTALSTSRIIVYSYPYKSLYPSTSLLPFQSVWVTVTRTITTTVTLSLRLVDTNLDMNARLKGGSTPSSSPSTSTSAPLSAAGLPLTMLGGIGLVAAGAISVFWGIRRANGRKIVRSLGLA